MSDTIEHQDNEESDFDDIAAALNEVDQDDVDRGADFLRLLAQSSLGTSDARDERLAGRRAMQRLEETQPSSTATRSVGSFDLRVAAELDIRGYTFEAEMRYRATLPADKPTRLMTRLAILLELKGFVGQALPLYVGAARAGEPDALLRLATISAATGKRGWARDLVQLAAAAMTHTQSAEIERVLARLKHGRREDDLGSVLGKALAGKDRADSLAYAVGSVLLAVGRSDLSRCAFAMAFARGHAAAGMSLLDLSGRRDSGSAQRAHAVIDPAWREFFRKDAERSRRTHSARHSLADLVERLRTDVPLDSVAALLTDFAPLPARGGSFRSLKRRLSVSAMQALLATARTITMLGRFDVIGRDPAALPQVERVGDRVCTVLRQCITTGDVDDEISLVGLVMAEGDTDDAQRSAEVEESCSRGRQEDPEERSMPGAVGRFGRAFIELSQAERQALVLTMAGVPEEEVGRCLAAWRMAEDDLRDVRSLLHAAIDRLRREQQGEQFDGALWREIEDCFSDAPEIVQQFNRAHAMSDHR